MLTMLTMAAPMTEHPTVGVLINILSSSSSSAAVNYVTRWVCMLKKMQNLVEFALILYTFPAGDCWSSWWWLLTTFGTTFPAYSRFWSLLGFFCSILWSLLNYFSDQDYCLDKISSMTYSRQRLFQEFAAWQQRKEIQQLICRTGLDNNHTVFLSF